MYSECFRCNLAMAAMAKLNSVWRSKQLPDQIPITSVMSHSPPTYVLEFSYAHILLVHTLISTFLS